MKKNIPRHNLLSIWNIPDPDDLKTKKCIVCGIEKPLTEFRERRDGQINYTHRNDCRECEAQVKREVAVIFKGIPVKPTHCQCCGIKTDKLVRDHCHETKEFRGWICISCNNNLGRFGDTLEKVLEKTMMYANYLIGDDKNKERSLSVIEQMMNEM